MKWNWHTKKIKAFLSVTRLTFHELWHKIDVINLEFGSQSAPRPRPRLHGTGFAPFTSLVAGSLPALKHVGFHWVFWFDKLVSTKPIYQVYSVKHWLFVVCRLQENKDDAYNSDIQLFIFSFTLYAPSILFMMYIT
jgi:hypothetical protein